jgi:hypothetical protein
MSWINEPKDISKNVGFIYQITNNINGRKYIGKKIFWNKKRIKPRKGYKKGRIEYRESDWREYNGSCKELLQDIEKFGIQNFRKEIIKICNSKWDMAYYEAKLQFDNNVLFDKNYYNGIINCRLCKPK